MGGVASQEPDRERAGGAVRLAMVHVPSHSLQRHKVATVMVLASVSTRLPWQNGHAVGRLIASLNRHSLIVGVSAWCTRDSSKCDRAIEAEG